MFSIETGQRPAAASPARVRAVNASPHQSIKLRARFWPTAVGGIGEKLRLQLRPAQRVPPPAAQAAPSRPAGGVLLAPGALGQKLDDPAGHAPGDADGAGHLPGDEPQGRAQGARMTAVG